MFFFKHSGKINYLAWHALKITTSFLDRHEPPPPSPLVSIDTSSRSSAQKGHQGHPRATSKLASWQEQEVPSEHSSFLLSAEVTDTCLNSLTERGQMPRCQVSLFYTLFPPLTSANVSVLHPSPSHWRQPFFRAQSCINSVSYSWPRKLGGQAPFTTNRLCTPGASSAQCFWESAYWNYIQCSASPEKQLLALFCCNEFWSPSRTLLYFATLKS